MGNLPVWVTYLCRQLTHRVRYYMQCLNVAGVACLTMLLELDVINNNTREQAIGFVGVRTTSNILFYLTLDA
jgi:hypothetical protein